MARVRVQQTPQPVRTIQTPQASVDVRPVHAPPQLRPVYSEPTPKQPYYPLAQTAVATTMPSQGVFISRRKIVWTAIAALLLVGFYAAYSNRERPGGPSGTLGTSQTLPGATSEAQTYYNEISPYVELPRDEAPTVLNISNAEEVKKDNAALTDIKNGDKMLFFTKSRKLVVYRPATKKVVAVVSLAAPAATTPSTTVPR